MRILTIFIAIMYFQPAFCQDEVKDKAFFVEPLFRVHGILPVDLGTNYLANANKGKVSFGINMSMFEYHNFRLAVGFDRMYYDVTDVSKAATVDHSRYNLLYAQILYEFPITKNFSVQPYVGFGSSEINFVRSSDTRINYFGVEANNIVRQRGINVRGGFYADYRIDKVISFFAGVGYVQSSLDVDTAPEFKSYFGEAKMLQINLGLKIGYSMKNKYLKNKENATNK